MGEPTKKLSKSPSQWLSFWSKNPAPLPGPTRPTPPQTPRRPPQEASSPPSGKKKPPTMESQQPSSSNPTTPPAPPAAPPSSPQVNSNTETEKVASSDERSDDGGGSTQQSKASDEIAMSPVRRPTEEGGVLGSSTQNHSLGSGKDPFSEEPNSKKLPNDSKLEEMPSQANVGSPKPDYLIPNRIPTKSSSKSETELPNSDGLLDGDKIDGKNSDRLPEETKSYEPNSEPVPKVESKEMGKNEIGGLKGKTPKPDSELPIPPLNPLVTERGTSECQPDREELQKSWVDSGTSDVCPGTNNNTQKLRNISITKNGKRGITAPSFDPQENGKKDLTSLVQNLGLDEKMGTKNGICVITLAGDNKGASMVIGGHDGSLPKQSNGSDPGVGGTNLRGNSSGAKEKVLVSTSVNSNSQGVNNSILNESCCHERDAGVHFAVTTAPPSEDGAMLKGGSAPASKERSQAVIMRNEAPTVRRRCLRALLMEDDEGEEEGDENKPRRMRHGCKYKCGEIDGKFGM